MDFATLKKLNNYFLKAYPENKINNSPETHMEVMDFVQGTSEL